MKEEFCTQCGSKLENGNFCMQCGAPVEKIQSKNSLIDKFRKLNISMSDIWFYLGLIILGITAITFVVTCFSRAGDFSTYITLYDGYIFLIPYYLVGFWPVISFIAVFFQRKSRGRYTGGVIQTILIGLITIAIFTFKLLLREKYMNSGVFFLSYLITLEYGEMLVKSIFFEIVACMMFVLGKKTDKAR